MDKIKCIVCEKPAEDYEVVEMFIPVKERTMYYVLSEFNFVNMCAEHSKEYSLQALDLMRQQLMEIQ